ncbi:hypothetical protein TELCIR_01309 [Teladorsagia circumcincta]|uniref:DEAD/DEAH box helicase domain-containing protein n=1 Tax=Teladorsagia circumcincta TaxID=45464 RepID=A0A2G9V2B6_TELCI|nr:hypothetical protein TELCIR_01309 [Teladorsagia circumcincta]
MTGFISVGHVGRSGVALIRLGHFKIFIARKIRTVRYIGVCSPVRPCGLDLKTQEAALRSGPDVVVATPGRLIDHLHNSPSFSLNNVEVFSVLTVRLLELISYFIKYCLDENCLANADLNHFCSRFMSHSRMWL